MEKEETIKLWRTCERKAQGPDCLKWHLPGPVAHERASTREVRVGSKGEILAKSRCFLLCLQQRKSLNTAAMSEKCQQETRAAQQTYRRITVTVHLIKFDHSTRQRLSGSSGFNPRLRSLRYGRGRYGILPEGILSQRVKMIEAVHFFRSI